MLAECSCVVSTGYSVSCHAHNAWEDTKLAALWTGYAGCKGGTDVAKITVDAAEGITDGVLTLAKWSVEALEEGFNVKSITLKIEAMAGAKKHNGITIAVSGRIVLLGHTHSFSVSVSFPPKLDHICEELWHWVKKKIDL